MPCKVMKMVMGGPNQVIVGAFLGYLGMPIPMVMMVLLLAWSLVDWHGVTQLDKSTTCD